MLRIGPEPTNGSISSINIRDNEKVVGILKEPTGAYSLDVSGTINCDALLINRSAFSSGSSVWDLSDSNTISYTNGNVGIGTTSPSELLHLSSAGNAILRLDGDTDNNDTTGPSVHMFKNNANHFYTMGSSVNATAHAMRLEVGTDNTTLITPGMEFCTGGNTGVGSGSVRLFINNDGNVGIGTTSPSSALQVVGFVDTSTEAASGVHMGMRSDGQNAIIRLCGSDEDYTSGQCLIEFMKPNENARARINYNFNNDTLQFRTTENPVQDTPIERMIIDICGNVGIGTIVPGSSLQVAGVIDTIDANTTEGVHLGMLSNIDANIILCGSGINKRGTLFFTHEGLDYPMGTLLFRCTESNSDGFKFMTGSGTAEPTTKMLISNYGNVGIGTTNPSYELDVTGTINCDELITGTIIDPDGLKINAETGDGGFTNNIALNIGENRGGLEMTDIILFTNSGYTTQKRNFISSSAHANVNVNGIKFGYSSNKAGTNLTTIYHFKNNGIATASTWSSTSDERMKFDVNDLSGCLSTIQQLEPKTYLKGDKPNEDRTNQNYLNQESGFLAQDIQKIDTLKHLVSSGSPEIEGVETEMLYLDYGSFIPYLVGAMKEQQIVIDSLTAKNDALQSELTSLKTILQAKGILD